MKRKTILTYGFLFLLPFLCAGCILLLQGGFGSMVDWYTQHIAIADSFRNFFYETGKLFPDFMNQLGGGQSVYHFAYYGLYRYDILLSYLFPFLQMSVILPIIHGASLSISACLLQSFLKRHVSSSLAFFGSLCFLLSAPLLYHTGKQVMFVIYFPFVMSGLLGCDTYLKKGKDLGYILSIAMCIITSFYFSIGAMLCWFLYCFMHTERKQWWKQFCSVFVIHFKAVLLSAFFWLPTAYAIFSTQAKSKAAIPLLSLLVPDFSFSSFLYAPYTIGLGILFLFILILWTMRYEKPRLASFCLLAIIVIPIFLFCMNLFLYARAKALIPLIPFIIYLGVLWLNQKQALSKWEMMILIAISFVICFNQPFHLLTLIDCLIAIFILAINAYTKRQLYYIYLPVMCFSFLIVNLSETKMPIQTIQKIEEKQEIISSLPLSKQARIADYHENAQSMNLDLGLPKSSIYSSIHLGTYNTFYYDVIRNNMSLRNRVSTLESGNPFFLAMLQHQYLITKNQAPPYYQPIKQTTDWTLYETKQVLPFAYGTSSVLSKSQFNSISFPENIIQLLMHPVVSNTNQIETITYSTNTKEKITVLSQTNHGNWLQQQNKSLHISSKKTERMMLQLQEPLKNEYLILSFDIKSNKKTYSDISITINQMRNRLSGSSAPYPNQNNHMTYYIAPSDVISLSVSKGDYTISNLKTSRVPISIFYQMMENKTPVMKETYDQKRSHYQAEITMGKDGWLITSLPYQKGIKVRVDEKEITPQIVNYCFTGIPITKGKHSIQITFHPPFQTTGRILSITTIIYLLLHRKRRTLCKTHSKKPSSMSYLDVSLL